MSCGSTRYAAEPIDANGRRVMDTITSAQRSSLMSRIRSKNTKPELKVRSILHGLGYRFRLHRKDLPGRPDIVLPRHKKIVLVQGCFWHGHGCVLASTPKSNQGYWNAKISGNRARDVRNRESLERQGWKILELWECEMRDPVSLEIALKTFMES